MPDVHAISFYYGELPVYLRLNLGTEMPETYRIQGSKGVLEVAGSSITLTPQRGIDMSPSYYAWSFPRELRDAYFEQWHKENDPILAQSPFDETTTFRGPDYDDVRPHLANFFDAVRTRRPVVEDAAFGHHAALACHMANESYFQRAIVRWDDGAKVIRTL
jgi:hypothetical protein